MKLTFAPLLGAAVLAGLAFPLSPAAAQTLTVEAHGFTIGSDQFKEAQATEGGFSPRIVALESIQNGNFQNAHIEASVLGGGSADYGTLAGSMEAQVRNQATFANFYTPRAEGLMRLSFADSGVVTSSTLALGTPVSMTFLSSLAASYFASGRVGDGKNFALAEFDGTIQDQTTLARQGSILVFGTPGNTAATYLFTLDTAVGRVLSLNGFMDVRAGAYIDGLSAPGDVLATSSIIASHTAHFYYEPTADLSLVAASGHDYAAPSAAPVPETSSIISLALLLGLGSATALRLRRVIS